ncbi:MAG TPA: glucose 1-dehydrogenase [Myxococcota bacterium]
MKRLDKRVALVTGGASGIGKATAKRLASEGARVVITDIQTGLGEAAVKEIKDAGGEAVFVQHDVTSESEWSQAIEKTVAAFGSLDILVNNAGVGDLGVIEDVDYAAYQKTIRITQDSVFLGMKAAHTALALSAKDKRASVINISSIFGASGGFGTSPAYHAAKGAVRLLTKTTALHWAELGIRVNSVHPGFIDTPALASSKDGDAGKAMIALTPMGHLGQPDDIAAAVAYLASDDAKFITGSELYVDGGYMAR